MQCVINEKKKFKIFFFLVTMSTKVGGVTKYEKILFLGVFELLQPFLYPT